MNRLLWPLLLALLVLAVYAPSITNGFVYDDGVLIVDAQAPESPTEVLHVFGERHWKGLPYYRPVPRSTMVLQKYLYGDNPAPYHVFNALLMALTGLAAYALLLRPAFGLKRGAAFLGAVLFAVHPVASSTVYPIASGRETLIPALFAIVAVWAWLGPGLLSRILTHVALVLALLSKEQAIVVPLLFALADATGMSATTPGRSVAARLGRYAPSAIIVVLYLAVRMQLFGGTGEHRVVLGERPLGPLQSLLHSLQSIFDPSLRLMYEPRFEAWFSLAHLAVATVGTLALAVWTARHWSDIRRQALFWTGWFLLAIAPTANVLHQEALFDERFVFLGSLGVIGLTLALVGRSWDRQPFRGRAALAGVVLILASAAVTVSRGDAYRDELSFLSQWVLSDPGSAKAHHGLGQYYAGEKDYEKARQHFEAAVRLQPNYAAAHNNLGSMLAIAGEPERAAHHFRQSMQFDPKHTLAYNNLARILESRGELDEAAALFRQSLEIDPSDATVYTALGMLELRRKRPDEAIDLLDEAVRRDPNQPRVHYELGRLWLDRGDKGRAEFHFDRAVLLAPDFAEAHNNLGMLLALRKEMARAKLHFESALRAKPDYVEAHLNYGNVLLYERDLEGGRRHIEEAVRLDPASAVAKERLAALDKALAEQRRAIPR